MKKQYLSPAIKVVRTQCECLLSISASGTEKVGISTDDYGEDNWE